MYKIMLEGIKQYENKLNLHWPVTYWLDTEAQTCRILSDRTRQTHEVYVNGVTYRNLTSMFPDIVHELCHCCLAERIDLNFSTIFFTDKWNKRSLEKPKEFSRLANELYFAWSHVDIWVNDFRHKYWPDLTFRDYNNFMQTLKCIIQQSQFTVLQDHSILLGIAQCQAEMGRLGLNDSLTPFSLLYNEGICMSQLEDFAEYFQSLPGLKFRLKKDLKVLEKSVQIMAKKLHFSVSPQLIREKGAWVWSLD
jgi:hypothetical protein